MSLVAHMRKMARNNAWSNYRLHRACDTLPDTELAAPRTSFFPSLFATLNHILAVDAYYIDALTGGGRGPAAFRDFVPLTTMTALAAAQAASDRTLVQFCDGLSEAALAGVVRTDRGNDGVIDERCADLLAHLFQHQIHHRGQVHAMLSGTTAKPPQLDEYFLAFDRAARRTDLAALQMDGPESLG